jgi:hypothetical protein
MAEGEGGGGALDRREGSETGLAKGRSDWRPANRDRLQLFFPFASVVAKEAD